MKTQIKINNTAATDVRATPLELRAATETIVNKLTELMRIHGIKSITVKPMQVGIKSLMDLDFTPLAAEPPATYLAIRKTVVRLLAEYMSIFGIIMIEIIPDDNDMTIIRDTWTSLIQRAGTLAGEEPAKAPPTDDPTNAPVTIPAAS